MRLHSFVLAATVATMVTAVALVSSPATAIPDRVGTQGHPLPSPCYTQPPDGSPNQVSSQYFVTSALQQYSDEAADDFVLSAPCMATSITIPGTYQYGTNPNTTWLVDFYTDAGGMPSQGPFMNHAGVGTYAGGAVTLNFPGVGLPANTRFWVSVQAMVPNDDDR
jgi:hypothetical protein